MLISGKPNEEFSCIHALMVNGVLSRGILDTHSKEEQ